MVLVTILYWYGTRIMAIFHTILYEKWKLQNGYLKIFKFMKFYFYPVAAVAHIMVHESYKF